MVRLCDQQYVQLNLVVNKPWVKSVVTAFNKLYKAEDATDEKEFTYTRQIKPLVDFLLDRIKMQTNNQYTSLSKKFKEQQMSEEHSANEQMRNTSFDSSYGQ